MYEKALAFIKRDLSIWTSYRFSFLLDLIGIFFSVLIFYFIAKLFGAAAIPYLKPYETNYFSFVLIGIAFSGYLGAGLSSFSGSIRREQMMGTLEAMLVTPTKLSIIVMASSLWNFLFTSFRVLIYLLIGVLLFGVEVGNANVLAALIILILTIISFSSLGIISASFIMVLKRGDPINWVFGGASRLLGGVYYPITILPLWLQKFSYLLPITYSLRAMRHALLQGYPISSLFTDIIALFLFSIIMLPIGIITFKYAVRKAKIDGSLIHY